MIKRILRSLPLVFLLAVCVFAQAPTPHNIALTWTASLTPNVTYTIYRATAASGPWTAIASGITGTNYTDATGTGGTVYFYEVDAADAAGNLSGPSNQANATFLGNPAAPTGLGAVSK